MSRPQTIREEVANSITHGVGVVFCLIAAPAIILSAYKHSNVTNLWAITVFAFGMTMVYFSSTFFHAIQHQGAKKILQIWDHISIFLLIGGSYTAIVVKFTNPDTAAFFLTIMWTIIAAGSILKIFFTGRFLVLEVILYLFLGWMAIFIIKPLLSAIPLEIFWWVLAGGLAYTFGVIFYMWKKLDYHHAVWHVFVLTGTFTHFIAIYNSIPLVVKV